MEIVNKDKEYKTDKHLVYSCQYHIIFCPKYRRRVLVNKIADRLKELIIEKQVQYKYKILEMEILTDHVHILADIHPRVGVYNTISAIKGYTSHTLREEFPELKKKLPTLWTLSKFISSVGSVSLEVVKKYIEDQKNK